MSAVAFPQPELVRVAKLSPTDLERTQQCRHLHTRLGFAYQLAFVRLANRFAAQEPLELMNGYERLHVYTCSNEYEYKYGHSHKYGDKYAWSYQHEHGDSDRYIHIYVHANAYRYTNAHCSWYRGNPGCPRNRDRDIVHEPG